MMTHRRPRGPVPPTRQYLVRGPSSTANESGYGVTTAVVVPVVTAAAAVVVQMVVVVLVFMVVFVEAAAVSAEAAAAAAAATAAAATAAIRLLDGGGRPASRTGGDVTGVACNDSGVVCNDSDSGTDAAPAAAPDGVLMSAECRLSVTDRYRCGRVLWHRHLSNLKPKNGGGSSVAIVVHTRLPPSRTVFDERTGSS